MIKIFLLLLFTQVSFAWASCLVELGDDDPIQKLSEDVSKVVEPTFSEKFKKGMEACSYNYSSSEFSATANRCGLDLEEFTLLKSYTGSLYGCLNQAARDPASYGDKIENIQYLIEKLNKGLLKLPPYHGFVSRGVEFPEDIRKLHKVDNQITYKSFTSTSTEFGFGAKDRLLIYSRSGRPIMGFSVFKGENEILFPAYSKFEIIHTFSEDNTNFYVMMEIYSSDNPDQIKKKKKEVMDLYKANYKGHEKIKISDNKVSDTWNCDQPNLLSPEKRKPIKQINLPTF